MNKHGEDGTEKKPNRKNAYCIFHVYGGENCREGLTRSLRGRGGGSVYDRFFFFLVKNTNLIFIINIIL